MASQITIMRVQYDPSFYRKYKRLDVRIQNKFDQKIEVFLKKPNEPSLNNHLLEREYAGHRSIDITNDYRAIYYEEVIGNEVVVNFVIIGTHDELYRPKN